MTVYKKSAVVLIMNNKGELALQLRAAHDDSYPSHWDFSSGGGIDEGETPIDAMEREIQEELGVHLKVEPVTEELCVYPVWNTTDTKEDYNYIFKTSYNGPFTPNPNEVERIGFFTSQTIENQIASGVKFHPAMLHVWQKGIISQTIAASTT